MADYIKIDIDVTKTTTQLRNVDRKVRKKSLRKGVTAATKVLQKEARRLAPRANGFLRMSLRTVVRMQKDGSVVGRVGQEKNKRFNRKRYKGSNVNRRGYAARIWWIESGTRSHRIEPSGKVLAWRAGGRKGTKGKAVFSRFARHPGSRARHVLERSARAGKLAAADAFNQAVSLEMQNIRETSV